MTEIIVGADGSDRSLAAVDWAAAGAARRDLALRIICAVPGWVHDWRASDCGGRVDDWKSHYRMFLERATSRAREVAPQADVSTDPDGRELLISCGAALCILRPAVMNLGRVPEVALLPDPDRPSLIARNRRTHRGPFLDRPVGAPILASLSEEVRREGTALRFVTGDTRAALSALTEVAERVQRTNPTHNAEAARWAPSPGSSRQDGVHQHAYPRATECSDPHYPMRDYARGQSWGITPAREIGAGGITGAVVILTTASDDRVDWLMAGQALQRLLLRGSADHVSAAFHTQALEIPELREFIRTRFCGGAHPQLLLRLGYTDGALETVRRPAEHLTHEEYS